MPSKFDEFLIWILKYKDSMKFSLRSKIFFLREIWYLIKWWVSMLEAVSLIKDNSDNEVLKSICSQIYISLKSWENLNRSLSRLPKYFNDWDVNIIKSWEASWELVEVLEYLANEYTFLYETRNKYMGAMLYPIVVFLVSIVSLFVLVRFVLPSIISIVNEFNAASMPLSTKIVVWMVDFVQYSWWTIIVVLFFMIFAGSIFLSTQEWRKWFQIKLLRFPIIWKLTRYYLLIKFLRYFKLLLYAGLTYVDLFKLMIYVIWHSVYTEMFSQVLVELRKGWSFTQVMTDYDIIIPKDVLVLLRVWQETASLSWAIENAIWLYEEEFKKMMDNLSKIIEPIMIVFVWWIVALIALSVFGIVWSVMDSVQNL